MIKNQTYHFVPSSTVYYVREGDPVVLTQADIDKAVQAAVAAATTGLQTKNSEVIGKLQKAQEQLDSFKDVDVAAYKAFKETVDADEDLKLIQAGKKAEVIAKHTERMRADYETKIKAHSDAAEAQRVRADKYQRRGLDNEIRAVATELHKGAVEDALLVARNVFSLDDNGNAVALDSAGNVVLGKDGKTALTPKEWMEGMKEAKPHWFPSMSSGGGSQGEGAKPGSKTITRAAFAKLDAVAAAATVKTHTITD